MKNIEEVNLCIFFSAVVVVVVVFFFPSFGFRFPVVSVAEERRDVMRKARGGRQQNAI